MRDLSASSLKTSVRRKMVPSDALSAAVVLVDARLARALAPMAEVMVKAKPSAGRPRVWTTLSHPPANQPRSPRWESYVALDPTLG